jgi:hypothetical protein
MGRCNCAPCLVCGNGKCDCDCVGGGPYLTREDADAATAKQSAVEIERECREAWKQAAHWRQRAEAAESQLAAQRERDGRWFPLLGTPFAIRRDMLNEEQAKRNHYQTLDQLASRGGLSPAEARAVWNRRPFDNMEQTQAFADLIAAAPTKEPQA